MIIKLAHIFFFPVHILEDGNLMKAFIKGKSGFLHCCFCCLNLTCKSVLSDKYVSK